MQIKRRALTAGATFFLAAATGHVMQNGGSISASLGVFRGTSGQVAIPASLPTDNTAADTAAMGTTAAVVSAETMPAIDTATIVSLKADANADPIPALPGGQSLGPRMLKVERGYIRSLGDADAEWSPFGLSCADPVLVLSAKPGAMVGVHLAAPCAPSSPVRVTVDGLHIDAVTDASGTLDLDAPALSVQSTVTASLPGAAPLSASTMVSGLADVRRVALTWNGHFDLALDAFEGGAGWGDAGHVQAGQIEAGRTAAEGGSTIQTLGGGDAPLAGMAQVYTGPAAGSAPKIEISAEVTPRTCGRILTGTLIRAGQIGAASEPVSLTMPDCDSLGGFVVLSVDADAGARLNVASSGG